MPKNSNTEALVTAAARQTSAISQEVESLRGELCALAAQLPEHPAVTGLFGASETIAAQLIAEIGDVRGYKNGKALVAFAGVDPGRDQSGACERRSVAITKNGSRRLRKSLTSAVECCIMCRPPGDPVYAFYKRKRDEGKHFYVCRVAAVNKFLRIYYARVKEYLNGVD